MKTLSPRAAALLNNISAERFTLLQRCLSVSQPFTAAQVGPGGGVPRANPRDLAALERLGLLIAYPPVETKRQGRRVEYRVAAETASAIFTEIAEAVAGTGNAEPES